tara:strand:+ start:508 stop:858 length:351 start_codon:yes stop_codon:yes gene_type:complete
MKYLIANDQATLTSLGGADETVMFPQDAVLSIETKTDTTSSIFAQSSLDPDADVELVMVHADISASATHTTFRTLVDEAVARINNDSKHGYTVLFDLLNNIKLPSQVLASSTVTED